MSFLINLFKPSHPNPEEQPLLEKPPNDKSKPVETNEPKFKAISAVSGQFLSNAAEKIRTLFNIKEVFCQVLNNKIFLPARATWQGKTEVCKKFEDDFMGQQKLRLNGTPFIEAKAADMYQKLLSGKGIKSISNEDAIEIGKKLREQIPELGVSDEEKERLMGLSSRELVVYFVVEAKKVPMSEEAFYLSTVIKELVTENSSSETLKKVKIDTSDGAKLEGFEIKSHTLLDQRVEDQKWMVCFVGNDDCCQNQLEELRKLSETTGYHILAVNCRGVAGSKDPPDFKGLLTTDNLVTDGMAACDHVMGQYKIPKERIVIQGQSQGGAIAAQVAAKKGTSVCIVRSFTTFKDAARELVANHFGKLIGVAAAHFIKDLWVFDTEKALEKVPHAIVVEHPNDHMILGAARLGDKLEQKETTDSQAQNFTVIKIEDPKGSEYIEHLWERSVTKLDAHNKALHGDTLGAIALALNNLPIPTGG